MRGFFPARIASRAALLYQPGMALTAADTTTLLDSPAVSGLIDGLVKQLAEAQAAEPGLVFVGIERRGVHLARRVAERLGGVPVGTLDISLYRDDLGRLERVPELRGTHIPFDVDEASVVLFDDVLFTGRTVRAALEELMDFGRPARVRLAVLLDRGHRQLPIQPDFCALVHPTAPTEYVRLQLTEVDGRDAVIVAPQPPTR